MKKKLMAYAVVPAVLGFGILGASVSSAHGLFSDVQQLSPDQIVQRQQTVFQNQAALLGISEAAVKEGWAQGKTMKEIAADSGITAEQLAAKMKAHQEAQMKAHLQTLVSAGVITQAQADSRFAVMQQKFTSAKGKGRFHRGFGF